MIKKYGQFINEELWHIGSSAEKVATKYADRISELTLKGGELNWDVANDGLRSLSNFNDTLDEILTDKKMIKFLTKQGTYDTLKKIKSNVGIDKYGRNRPDGLYLGDTQGLNTLKIDDWVNSTDDEAKGIVLNQLKNWLNTNIESAIKILTTDD